MTTTSMGATPGTSDGDSPVPAVGRSNDEILDEWLKSDPAPGTYNEYRKGYFALRR